MKNLFLFLFLYLLIPLNLFAQQENPGKLYGLFTIGDDGLRTLVNSNRSQVKLSEKEINEIIQIINSRKKEFISLNDQANKSIPYGPNGYPIGKADPVLLDKIENIYNEIQTSIYNILGEKRYNLLRRTLIDEAERKNSSRMKKSLKPR